MLIGIGSLAATTLDSRIASERQSHIERASALCFTRDRAGRNWRSYSRGFVKTTAMGCAAQNSKAALNCEIENSHVRQPGSVQTPSRPSVRRVVNTPVGACV